MKFPLVESKVVVVTGSSSGIGRATARRLRKSGWQVIPTARKERDLRSLKEEGFEPLQLDLAESESVQEAGKKIQQSYHLGALVNNAGFGQPGASEDLTRDMMREQFEVNLFGLQELSNILIPLFRRQKFGRLVNVSSVVGQSALPFMSIYSASKFALEALSDCMRVELSDSGVSVSLIEPGPIATQFGNAARQHGTRLDPENSVFARQYQTQFLRPKDGQRPSPRNLFRKDPDAVAKAIQDALESPRPKPRYQITLPAHLAPKLRVLLPTRAFDRVLTWLCRRGFDV